MFIFQIQSMGVIRTKNKDPIKIFLCSLASQHPHIN